MPEGFSNPIIGGGGGLVYPSIHSPNYVPNVSGWSVNKDGTAQFTGLAIIGGTFTGTNFVMNQAGIFFYGGTPAAGNLIESVAAAAGTDGFGNAYLAGDVSYVNIGGTYFAVSASTVYVSSGGYAGPYAAVGGFTSPDGVVLEIYTSAGGAVILDAGGLHIQSGKLWGASGTLEIGDNIVFDKIGQRLDAIAPSNADPGFVQPTYSIDPALQVTVAPNAAYAYELDLHYFTTSGVNENLYMQYYGPAGYTLNATQVQPASAGSNTASIFYGLGSDTHFFGAPASQATVSMQDRGIVLTGATGGTFGLKFARGTAGGAIFRALNSSLRLRRMA
jgi:hypothetical protein